MNSGVELFRGRLEARALADIESWVDDPELSQIVAKLHASTQPRAFLNSYAEALVARHLRQAGCVLRFELPTPSGRRCDFEVTHDSLTFFLHVKHLNTEHLAAQTLNVSPRLRYLELVERPYLVNVRWNDGLNDDQMQAFVHDAAEFIRRSRVGDEHIVRDERGVRLGHCRILAPWDGPRVSLTFGLPEGFGTQTIRMRRLLERAYQQFMPRGLNVILLGSSNPEDAVDFEDALLGTQIERWDAMPPRGQRIAHGRDADGFWHERRFEESMAAGWFRFRPDSPSISPRLWFRAEAAITSTHAKSLQSLLDSAP